MFGSRLFPRRRAAKSAPGHRGDGVRLFAGESRKERAERQAQAGEPWIAARLWFLALLALGAIGGIGARIYYLQVLRGPYYYELSENNYLFERPITGPRGNILAADGSTIAINRTSYSIEMSPFGMSRERIDATVKRLAELLGRPELERRAESVARLRPAWKSLVLASDLDLVAVSPVLERAYQLPGVVIEPRYARLYPQGALMAHVTGYVAPIPAKALATYLERGYLRTDSVGMLGVERQYEELLRGRAGQEVLVKDAFGRPRSSRVEKPALRGNDIVLTLDPGLQRVADAALQGKKGVAVAMDPRDGAILAMVALPDYDPNDPMRGAATHETSTYNRAIRGAYAPASTFKIVTASGGLARGWSPENGVHCDGNFHLSNAGRPFWCDVRWGHRWLDLKGAIQKSCNVFFYTWSDRLGHEGMVEASRWWGFGSPTGIDLMPPGRESGGICGAKPGRKAFPGSVVHMGIGQGELIGCSPLQLLQCYAALANGGTLWRPHLFLEERSPHGEVLSRREPEVAGKVPLEPWMFDVLREGCRLVVQEQGGTAFRAGFRREWDVAGKTGSAEVHGQKLTNGWFAAWAPNSAPEIAVVVLVEGEGHGGSTAAPIVAAMLRHWFEHRAPAPGPPAGAGIEVAEAGR